MNLDRIKVMMNDYNELIARVLLVSHWMDDEKNSIEHKEMKVKSYQELISKSDIILKSMKKDGFDISDSEVMNGFNISYRIKRFEAYGY